MEHREELHALLGERFATKPYRWWELRFTKFRVPHGRPLDFAILRLHEEMKRYLPTVTHPKYGTYHVGAIPLQYQEATLDPPWVKVDPLGSSTTPQEVLERLVPKEV